MEVFSVFASMGITDVVCGPLQKMKSAFSSTGNAGNSFGNKMGGIAKKMMPIAVVAGLILASLSPCISTAADFEAGLSNLGAISRASSADLALMEQSALDLGASTAFSALQVTEAQTELAKKGFTANQVVGAMPGLLDLAAAAQTDLATAASVTAGALKSFNMDATESSKVADMIAYASSTSATDVDGLGMALQNAGAVVSSMGGDFALLTALTGKLADANINAAVGSTAIKTMYTRLAAPTGAAAKSLKALDVETKNASRDALGFVDVMKNLETALAGKGSADKAAYLKNIFGEEALGSVNALLNQGIDSLDAYYGKIKTVTGFSKETAAKQLDNLKGALTILGSAWEGLQITIGKVFLPVLTPLVKGLSTVVGWLGKLAGTRVGQILIGLVASLAVVAVGVTAFAAAIAIANIVLPIMAGSLIPVIAGVWSFTVALLACPLTWIVVAVVAVGAALYWLYNKFDIVKAGVDSVLYVLGYSIGVLYRVGKVLFEVFLNPIGAIKRLFGFVKNVIPGIANTIKGAAGVFLRAGAGLWSAFVGGIKSKLGAPVAIVKTGLQKLRNLLPFSDAKEGPLSTLTLSGARIMETMANGVKGAAPVLQGAASVALAGVVTAMPVDVSQVKSSPAVSDPLPIVRQADPAESRRQAVAKNDGKTIHIHKIEIALPNVQNADGFVKDLQRLVEQYDV